MRHVFVLLIICCFLMAGCSKNVQVTKGIDVYTFKKDRVDQDLTGNRGFAGEPTKEPDKPRNTKRTLIGVDIEMPSSLIGERSEEGEAIADAASKPAPAAPAVKGKTPAPSSKPEPETIVIEEEEITEEEWIK